MSYPRREVYMELISSDALNAFMAARDMSNRKLALAAGDPALRSTISHLRSGARKTCGIGPARAIEKGLGAPAGSLFMPKLANANAGSRRPA